MTPPLRLTSQQYDELLAAIHRNRVAQTPQGNSHLEAWDVRRTLNRIFGFGGWEEKTKRLWLIREIEYPPGAIKYRNGGTNDKPSWTVVYGAEVALTVYGLGGSSATFEDGATCDAPTQPTIGGAHDQALKGALSQALKRCAVNLGDQFGLSLYNGGSLGAVVVRTLAPPTAAPAPAGGPLLPRDEAPVQGEHNPHAAVHDGEDGTYVDPDDGQTYVTPPSGGLADDMRDADVHPLPPVNGNGHHRPAPAAPAPAGGETAAQRAIRQRREADAARQHPPVAKDAAQERPARPRPPRPADDGDTAALVEEILACTDMERFTALWNMGKRLTPAGLDTDVRRMISDDAAALLALDRSEPVPLGAVIQRSAKHFEQATESVRTALAPVPTP